MQINSIRKLFLASLISAFSLWIASPAGSAEPGQQSAKGTDLQGDPLPAGAVARLGTLRWRHGSPISFLSFLGDANSLLTVSQDHTIRVWDVATGKELRRLGKS